MGESGALFLSEPHPTAKLCDENGADDQGHAIETLADGLFEIFLHDFFKISGFDIGNVLERFLIGSTRFGNEELMSFADFVRKEETTAFDTGRLHEDPAGRFGKKNEYENSRISGDRTRYGDVFGNRTPFLPLRRTFARIDGLFARLPCLVLLVFREVSTAAGAFALCRTLPFAGIRRGRLCGLGRSGRIFEDHFGLEFVEEFRIHRKSVRRGKPFVKKRKESRMRTLSVGKLRKRRLYPLPDIKQIFFRIYRDFRRIPEIRFHRSGSESGSGKISGFENFFRKEGVFFSQLRVGFRPILEFGVMEDEERKRFGEVFVLIGKGIAGNEVRELGALFLNFVRVPRYLIELVGRIAKNAGFEIMNVDHVTEFMDEYRDFFAIRGYGGRDDELVARELSTGFDAFGIDGNGKGGDLFAKGPGIDVGTQKFDHLVIHDDGIGPERERNSRRNGLAFGNFDDGFLFDREPFRWSALFRFEFVERENFLGPRGQGGFAIVYRRRIEGRFRSGRKSDLGDRRQDEKQEERGHEKPKVPWFGISNSRYGPREAETDAIHRQHRRS